MTHESASRRGVEAGINRAGRAYARLLMVVLALVSALCFGLADFAGGLLARRTRSAVVSVIAHLTGVVVGLGVVLVTASPVPGGAAMAWGAASGVGTGLGALALFQAMRDGRFSIVVPLSVVAGVVLPVFVGRVFLDDRIDRLAWSGIGVGLLAVWLLGVRRREPATHRAAGRAVGLALASGVAFAVQYVGLERAGESVAVASLWPIVANRVVAVVVIAPLVLGRPRIPGRVAAAIVGTGLIWFTAIATYTLAAARGPLGIAVVLTSLYPAIPVVLGIAVLRERLTRLQVAGLACAAAAVVLITA